MKKQIILTAQVCALALASQTAFAQDELGWSGKGELGVVSTRGNSNTETTNLNLNATYNLEKWRHSLGFSALKSSDSGEDTAERYELLGQTDYKIDEISYWFGSFRYESDEFSQFDNQAALALGYGRQLINTEVHQLKGELGLGYRRSELRLTNETQTDPILRGGLNYIWVLSDNASFSNDLLIEAGSDNTFATNVSALNTKINDAFGLKLAYEMRHNTDVDEPVNNTDVLTTINLVYNFK